MTRSIHTLRGRVAAVLALSLALAACDDATGSSGPRPVTVRFAAQVGDAAFACGQSYAGIGTSGSTIRANDFRFFVSNVRMLRADGSEASVALTQDGATQIEDIALLDFENGAGGCTGTAATNDAVEGTVEGRGFTGLRFTLGIPPVRNHGDASAAPAPLNTTGLFWSWNLGYMFFKADLASTGRPGGWFAHLGSTGCTSTTPGNATCTSPNRVEVTLTGFDADRDVVVADLRALLAASNVDVELGGAPGCMSGATDGDCGPLMPRFGVGAAQQLFRVRAR